MTSTQLEVKLRELLLDASSDFSEEHVLVLAEILGRTVGTVHVTISPPEGSVLTQRVLNRFAKGLNEEAGATIMSYLGTSPSSRVDIH